MNAKPESNPSNPKNDPRLRANFQPSYYPKANGQEAPPVESTERNERLVLQFLEAYYDLNLAHAQLVETRQSPASLQRQKSERKCLQKMEQFLILRDSLEDQFAPLGVIAEPVVEGGVTVDVKFSFGHTDAAGRRRSNAYTITAYVPIPLPRGTKFEDVPIQIEGPGFNPE